MVLCEDLMGFVLVLCEDLWGFDMCIAWRKGFGGGFCVLGIMEIMVVQLGLWNGQRG